MSAERTPGPTEREAGQPVEGVLRSRQLEALSAYAAVPGSSPAPSQEGRRSRRAQALRRWRRHRAHGGSGRLIPRRARGRTIGDHRG